MFPEYVSWGYISWEIDILPWYICIYIKEIYQFVGVGDSFLRPFVSFVSTFLIDETDRDFDVSTDEDFVILLCHHFSTDEDKDFWKVLVA